MPYAERDERGNILALHQFPTKSANERIAADDPAVMGFLAGQPSARPDQHLLSVSDLELMRVVEDLVDILIDKGVITFTDLPEAAQHKLIRRRRVRDQLRGEAPLIDNTKEIL